LLMEKKTNFNKQHVLFLFTLFVIGILFTSEILADDYTRPSAIIKLPENENAILVEKKNQTLFLYSFKSGELVIQQKMPCSTGETPGVKQKSGDKKTPEGIYFLKDEYEEKYLSAVYGIKAFPLDYPNLMDKRTGKKSSTKSIKIHLSNRNKRSTLCWINGLKQSKTEVIMIICPFILMNTFLKLTGGQNGWRYEKIHPWPA